MALNRIVQRQTGAEENNYKGDQTASQISEKRFIAGFSTRYRDLLEINNLNKTEIVTFDDLQQQAHEIDQRGLDSVGQLQTNTYTGVFVAEDKK